jgi:hypothetical protein
MYQMFEKEMHEYYATPQDYGVVAVIPIGFGVTEKRSRPTTANGVVFRPLSIVTILDRRRPRAASAALLASRAP